MSGTTNIPCCYLILKKDNKVLFVRRQNTGFQDNQYGLVAGHVEEGESFREGVVREALEEVNAKVSPDSLKYVHTMHRYQTPDNIRIDVFFETTEWSGELKNMEPEKHSEFVWLDINNLPDDTQDFTAYALKEIVNGKTYSEYGWDLPKS